ncbi:MAG: 16S rRNA (adenine(1518)-N(6)/adenine(1519)-N(6))-dimethyltransferase, partial [Clostridiales bacterium]|nr:16S rRNA (adenine(1518)-N(6)/adenine(1519)-N(6))-dimethyltransferase [Clostridiales bacterium]
MKLLEDKLPISAITVMVQKEAAQRICAEVGTRQSGAVTVSVNYYAKPKMLFSVGAGSFMPAPKVDSAVIRLDVLKEPPVKTDEQNFFRVVKAAFSQRRKTLANSLSSGLSMDKAAVNEILIKSNVPVNARAEQLKLSDFAEISNNL